MNKSLIHDRFAKNINSYNDNAKIQKRMAEKLLSFIKTKNPKSILELGCGTGFLTELINKRFEIDTYEALDIVGECQKFISQINPKIKFLQDDIEEFLKKDSKKYDLIISNASLQWVDNFEDTINLLRKKLNINGEAVFSTFGKENFREIYQVLGTSLEYFSEQELLNIIPDAEIETEIHIMAFQSPKDVLRHLQLTGVNSLENRAWTKKDLIKFENGYSSICPQRPTLTYNPIYIRIS